MSKRSSFVVMGTLSLMLGGIIYLLFRENSYVAIIFNVRFIDGLREATPTVPKEIVSFYLADFLWSFSLSSYLLAIFLPIKQGAFFCGLTAFLCGVIWEILQFVNAVSGTGDMLDMIMYLIAAVLTVMVYRRRWKNEKN